MKEPKGLLIGGIAAGVAGVMADLLSPIYATSFHGGFGLSNTKAGLLVTAACWVGRGVLGVIGLLLCAIGVFMVALIREPWAYIAGNLAVNLGFWVILPLGLSVAADLDRNSGRLVAFILGLSSAGLALGPTLAGPLLGGEDTTLGGWVFGIIGLIAVPFIIAPANAADREARANQERLAGAP